jgi:hypothetical protein
MMGAKVRLACEAMKELSNCCHSLEHTNKGETTLCGILLVMRTESNKKGCELSLEKLAKAQMMVGWTGL